MTKTTDHVLMFVTAAGAAEAETIARALVTEKLAACANALPGMKSLYWWKGKIESATEVLLIIKSRAPMVERITKRVKELHSYEVPEVIAVPITGGNADYLAWIEDSLKIAR